MSVVDQQAAFQEAADTIRSAAETQAAADEAARVAAEQAAAEQAAAAAAEAARVEAERAAAEQASAEQPVTEPAPANPMAGKMLVPWVADPNPENAMGGYWDTQQCPNLSGSTGPDGLQYCD